MDPTALPGYEITGGMDTSNPRSMSSSFKYLTEKAPEDSVLRGMEYGSYKQKTLESVSQKSKPPKRRTIDELFGSDTDGHVIVNFKSKANDESGDIPFYELHGKMVGSYFPNNQMNGNLKALTNVDIFNERTVKTIDGIFKSTQPTNGNKDYRIVKKDSTPGSNWEKLATDPNGKALFDYANSNFHAVGGWQPVEAHIVQSIGTSKPVLSWIYGPADP